ncbi:cell division protein SepF [Miniphocaeibacter halophilus]|uniref:Cell division protein SepF n=1 Tax=Miniphocaeibacter halophilus TaxID=2931922 RepID=A0AC61MQV4_9FIRM|nr:cell division protein SepF [Miniphocaeibacter halophilus]QQK07693.1 cell division protein SepF [Miniphocaeibacter halophilus]
MGVFDKFKNLIGLDDNYEDDYYNDDYYEDDYYDEGPSVNKNSSSNNYYSENDNESSSNKFKKSNVVSIKDNYVSDRVKILIHEPIKFDDAPLVLDDIISKNIVVLNLEMLDVDTKRKTFDFVSGGIYSINGKMQKVTKDIFVIAPKELEIDGKIKDQIQSKGYYQL